MRGKVFLVIALYMILGIIGFVDFGLQGYLFELVGWRTSTHQTVRQKLTEKMNIRTVSPGESQEASSVE